MVSPIEAVPGQPARDRRGSQRQREARDHFPNGAADGDRLSRFRVEIFHRVTPW